MAANDAGIPIVDLGSPNAPQELLAASVTHGFIFIKQESSGLSQRSVDNIFDIVSRCLSVAQKSC